MQIENENGKIDNTDEIGKQAATLSLIEIGLGSFLHSLKIPLSGHLLSINQIVFLARTCFKLQNTKPSLQISLIASFLKSLSPAGKKLTPMLAIAAQGILFYLGIFFFGINYVGLFVASSLSALWAFTQPVLFIFLIFGQNSFSVANYFLKEIEKVLPSASRYLVWAVAGIILIKILAAFFISIIALKLKDEEFEKFQNKMLLKISSPEVSPTHHPAYLALKDLFSPLFIISFGMTTFFFLFSNTSSVVSIAWNLMRPLAIGFILFFIIRAYPIENLSLFLHKKGFMQLSKILNSALKVINQYRGFKG